MPAITGSCGPYAYPSPALAPLSRLQACLGCLGLSLLYVSSLYLWRGSATMPRDHPTTLKRRMISVSAVTIITPMLLVYFGQDRGGIASLLGLSTELGLISWRPPLLSLLLFLGPLAHNVVDGISPYTSQETLHLVRNLIVAPITEEVVFRASSLPLLLAGGFSPCTAVFVCPLFFGLAHIHHGNELRLAGHSISTVIVGISFQFAYTSLFGAFASYIFLRTGQLMTVVLVHSFCNMMGFPDFGAIFEHPRHSVPLTALLLIGVAGFVYLFGPLTRPL